MIDKLIVCHACDHPPFDSYKELALHLITQKKTHKNRASQIWAKKFLTRQEYLDKKVSRKFDGSRLVITDEQKEVKADTKRILSGETKYVPCKCPRCKTGSKQFLEKEHVESIDALKEGNCYLKIREGCK